MPLPTYEALLRERFDDQKAQAQSLISAIVSEASGPYKSLLELAPALIESAAHFGEPLTFQVDAPAVALRQRVMELLGPIVAASAEQKG